MVVGVTYLSALIHYPNGTQRFGILIIDTRRGDKTRHVSRSREQRLQKNSLRTKMFCGGSGCSICD
jgi:hypothetical protein